MNQQLARKAPEAEAGGSLASERRTAPHPLPPLKHRPPPPPLGPPAPPPAGPALPLLGLWGLGAAGSSAPRPAPHPHPPGGLIPPPASGSALPPPPLLAVLPPPSPHTVHTEHLHGRALVALSGQLWGCPCLSVPRTTSSGGLPTPGAPLQPPTPGPPPPISSYLGRRFCW